jgi:hypothetical protein
MTSSNEAAITPLQTLVDWVKQRYRASWQLRAQVLKLIRTYQDTPATPTPFAGREAVLQQLDAWLQQTASRLLLVSGAAGRGKTALLLHWMERVIRRDSAPSVLYLPISIRFNTADERAGVQLLFAALSDVFRELCEGFPQQPEHSDYLEGIAAAWRHLAARPGQPFLLVVDGLDEASHHWFQGRHILPTELPSNLHVLLAARHKPGQATGAAWLEDLGTTDSGAVLAIDRLGPEAMAEVVQQLATPLDRLAGREPFLEALYRLTDDGDPLLVTLWLGQIWRNRAGLPNLDAQALTALQPSFEGFYGVWMQEQVSVWQEHSLPIRLADFELVLQVLALAQGPLRLPDLLEVLSVLDPACPWDAHSLRAGMATAHRLVVGDGEGQGYVLVHPRLAHHFQAQLEVVPARLRAVQEAFRDWGVRTVARLNSGEQPPEQCPAYLLTHHVTTHIDSGGEHTADTLEQHFLPLLQAGWARAWYAHTGAWQGYLQDLARIAAWLQAFNRSLVRQGRHGELLLAHELRAALLAATVRSMGSSLPLDLIAGMVRAGIWSLARGARAARECPEAPACLAELAGVARERGDGTLAQQLAEEALDACAETPEDRRGGALTAVAPRLAADSALLLRATQIACTLQHRGHRWRVLLTVAGKCQGEAGSTLRRQAFETAAKTRDFQGIQAVAGAAAGEDRELLLLALALAAEFPRQGGEAGLLCAVAPRLRSDSLLLQRALDLAAQLSGETSDTYQPQRTPAGRAAEMVSILAPQLAGDGGLLQRALNVARAISEPVERAGALIAVAEAVAAEPGTKIRQEAFQAVRKGRLRRINSVPLLAALARQLQSGGRDPALQAAWKQSLTHASVEVLIGLSAVVGGAYGQQALQQALRKADCYHLKSLVDAVGRLDGPDREAVLQRVWELLGGTAREPSPGSGRTARSVWQRHSEAGTGEIGSGWHVRERQRVRWLPRLAAVLQGEFRREALQAILSTPSDVLAGLRRGSRLEILGHVARLAEGDAALLQQALAVTAGLYDAQERDAALAAMVEVLARDPACLARALDLARSIREPDARASALAEVARKLPAEPRRTALGEALDAVAATQDPDARFEAHVKVVEVLQGDEALLRRALAIAAALPEKNLDGWAHRVRALCAVAGHLQGKARLGVLRQAVETAVRMNLNRLQSEDSAALLEACRGEPRIWARLRKAAERLKPGSGSFQVRCAAAGDLRGSARRRARRYAVEASVRMTVGWARDLGMDALLAVAQDKEPLPQQVLDVTAGLQGAARAYLLCDWALLLPGRAGDALLEEAMAAAASSPRESVLVHALTQIIADLPADHTLQRRGLDLADRRWPGGLPAELRFVMAARALREDAGAAVESRALEAAGAIGDTNDRICLLVRMAQPLQGSARRALLSCALNAACSNFRFEPPIGSLQGDRVLLHQAIETAAASGHFEALELLAAEVRKHPGLKYHYLQQIQRLSERSSDRIALSLEMAKDYPELMTYDLWSCLLAQSRLDRHLFLGVIGRLVMSAVQLTGSPGEAYRMAAVVQDVCTDWP